MAKALVLSDEALAVPVQQPRAAQPSRTAAPLQAPTPVPKAAKPPKAPQVPLQIRIEASEATAIKRAALDADQTISEFMLACFHDRMRITMKPVVLHGGHIDYAAATAAGPATKRGASDGAKAGGTGQSHEPRSKPGPTC